MNIYIYQTCSTMPLNSHINLSTHTTEASSTSLLPLLRTVPTCSNTESKGNYQRSFVDWTAGVTVNWFPRRWLTIPGRHRPLPTKAPLIATQLISTQLSIRSCSHTNSRISWLFCIIHDVVTNKLLQLGHDVQNRRHGGSTTGS